jgi:hypothetical protein
VVAERLIVAPMLRFKPAKNVLSDTLLSGHQFAQRAIRALPAIEAELFSKRRVIMPHASL